MNAIEIRSLNKSFRGLYAVNGLNMTVPVGAIYGFIGENGSGKSTTMKLICGHLVPNSGSIRLFGRDYRDAGVRARIGALIENTGCFPESSIYQNLMMQAINWGIAYPNREIRRVLRIVRMDGEETLKFKKCSLGMKQRIGIAMALLGNPRLLILDEPINGLDADGMCIMREILLDLSSERRCTILISSHILSELEKIATHYGIIRQGRMLREMTAQELENSCRTFTVVLTADPARARMLLGKKYSNVKELPDNGHSISRQAGSGQFRIYDAVPPEKIVSYLHENGISISEVYTDKIGLEEYYTDLLKLSRHESA